jgi:hypothetical protein
VLSQQQQQPGGHCLGTESAFWAALGALGYCLGSCVSLEHGWGHSQLACQRLLIARPACGSLQCELPEFQVPFCPDFVGVRSGGLSGQGTPRLWEDLRMGLQRQVGLPVSKRFMILGAANDEICSIFSASSPSLIVAGQDTGWGKEERDC